MATYGAAPPPYTPDLSLLPNSTHLTIEHVEAAHNATRLQRYLLEIIAYSLRADISKLVKAVPFQWPTYDGFRPSLLQNKEQAYLLRLSHTIAYMYRQVATSTLEDCRTILLEVVGPSRTLKIEPGVTLALMAAYANDHPKSFRQKRERAAMVIARKRKHDLIADLAWHLYASERSSRTSMFLNVISQLVLQLSPNDVIQKALGLALDKYHRGLHQPVGFMMHLDSRYNDYRNYLRLAEFLTGIPMIGENGTWQQLLALMPYDRHVVPVTPWTSR
jgi:hypothetical protein